MVVSLQALKSCSGLHAFMVGVEGLGLKKGIILVSKELVHLSFTKGYLFKELRQNIIGEHLGENNWASKKFHCPVFTLELTQSFQSPNGEGHDLQHHILSAWEICLLINL